MAPVLKETEADINLQDFVKMYIYCEKGDVCV